MPKVEIREDSVVVRDRGGKQTTTRVAQGDWMRAVAKAPTHMHAEPHFKDGKKLRAPGARDYLWLWYLRRYELGDARDHTVRQARREVMRIAGILGDKPVASLTPADCQAVMDAVADKSRESQKATLKYLKASLRDAVEVGALGHRIDRSPAAAIKVSSKERRQPGSFLRYEEQAPFLEAIAGRESANAIRLMLLCGLRLGEAHSLRWEQVELGEHWAPCIGVLRFGDEVKERRGKLVPVPELCALEPTDPWRVCTVSERTIRDDVTRAAKAIGVDRPISPHSLRRTYARTMYFKHGVTLYELRDLLGHSNITTTQRYLEGGSEDVLGKVAGLGR